MRSNNNKIKNLDLMPTKKLVDLFLNKEAHTLRELKKQKANITKAINLIIKKVKLGGRVIYIGSGTSGRLGILDAVECKPTFSTNTFQGIMAGGKNAFLKAKEGAEDNKRQAIKDLKKIKLSENDVLVGISASGETPYTLSAIKFAKKKKIATIAIASLKQSTLARISNISISPNINNEFIEGSSRLSSGTAQKIILNTLSTISMTKSGNIFQNLMIDVQPTNKKLVKRAIGIISSICKVPLNKAKFLFYKSKKNIKVAIVMHFKKCDLKTANTILQQSQFNLRQSLTKK